MNILAEGNSTGVFRVKIDSAAMEFNVYSSLLLIAPWQFNNHPDDSLGEPDSIKSDISTGLGSEADCLNNSPPFRFHRPRDRLWNFYFKKPGSQASIGKSIVLNFHEKVCITASVSVTEAANPTNENSFRRGYPPCCCFQRIE